jgi:hypothetical protein
MPPTLKGDLWPLFHREASLNYMGGTVYARCKACTSKLSLTAGTALRGPLKIDGSVTAGRLAAKQLGLVIGRDRDKYSHVQKCSLTSSEAKMKAEAYWKSKKTTEATTTPPESATASGWGRSTDLSLMRAPLPSAKRRKIANNIGEYAAFGDRFRHDVDEHSCLIAEFVSV